jgi:2-oxoglutarate dehydrogenase E2 component (dihydrolipoamide succinyltransferase)
MSNDVYEVSMPKLGETVTEGVVSRWLKQAGDTVAFDDPLFEVSTDKVDSEIPSPYDGVLLEILVNEGETVPVGTPVARIGEPGAQAPSAPAAPAGKAEEVAGTPEPVLTRAASATATAPATPPALAGNGQPGTVLSPVVRRLAVESGVDLASVTGSGASGRIRREDVERAIAASPTTAPPRPGPEPAPATVPTARPAPTMAPPPAPAAAAAQAPSAAAGASAGEEVVKLSRMRLITADLMVKSLKTSAHVWTSVEVDFERVEQVRQRHKEQFRKTEGASLTYLPFIARAVCDALRAFPAVNCSIDIEAQTMTLHHYVNLGIAVDLDEQGLVAPVVKNADSLNIRGIARGIAAVAAAARARKLTAGDMTGSTFTITNPGPFASYASAPVINQPNVAILSTDGIKRRPVAVGDAIAIHHTSILSLSYDHRAFDGSTASKFLLHIRDAIQDRDWDTELT